MSPCPALRRLAPSSFHRLAAVLLLFLSSRSGFAQYSVSEVQPLAFGILTQGVTEIVPYTDTFRRGVVNVDGAGQVYIRVVLPAALTSALGAAIPLQFLNGDVAATESGRPPAAFDPLGSTRVNLGKGTASLLMGGRAMPAANQRAGLYSATMTIIVSSTKF